jgi:uncharacterized protein
MLWIVRILVILLIVRFLVTMVRQAVRHAGGGVSPPGGRPKRQPERLGGTLVQDPQCGTYLPKERALTLSAAGTTQYFCSDKCRDQWKARAAG